MSLLDNEVEAPIAISVVSNDSSSANAVTTAEGKNLGDRESLTFQDEQVAL